MRRSILSATLVLLLLPCCLAAQGEWQPEGAEFTRPRLMITPQGIDTLWYSLQRYRAESDPQFREIYESLYWDAVDGNPPTDTLETSSRRENARFAKNVAFVLTVNRTPVGTWATVLAPSVRRQLEPKLLLSLSRINSHVNDVLQYTEWQWRTKELIDYLSAYDMAVGLGLEGPEMDRARSALQKFAGLLYQEATREVAGQSFFTLVRNNHALMVCGALGTAAIVLNDAGSNTGVMQPEKWMAAALYWSDDLLWRAEDRLSEPDEIAGYAEGPHYLRYALLNLLPFWRGLQSVYPVDTIEMEYRDATHRIPHPFTHAATRRLAEWINGIMTQDGLIPSIEDTYVDEGFPELSLLGYDRYFMPISSPYTTLSKSLQSTVDMRGNYLATGMVVRYWERPIRWWEPLPPLLISRAAGTASIQIPRLVNRVENVENTIHLGVIGENGRSRIQGGGHNQSDAASFYLTYGRRRLALDPGYISYARRDEVAEAKHHNMILVDGEGPPSGGIGNVGEADAIIDSVWFGEGVTHTFQGLQVSTSYRGAEILRRFYVVENQTVVILDDVESEEPHRYTWQVHGIDGRADGSSTDDTVRFSIDGNMARWRADSAALSAHVISTDSSMTVDSVSGVHEVGYDRTAPHATFRATTGESREARFLSVLHPTPGVDIDVLSDVTDQEVRLEIDGRHLWSMAREYGLHEVRTTRLDSLRVDTDADLLNLVFEPDGQLSFMMMEEGSRVTMNGIDYLVSADTIRSVFCYHRWGNELHVRFSGSGTYRIVTGFEYHPWVTEHDNPALTQFDRVPIGDGLYRLDICVDRPTTVVFRHYLDVPQEGSNPDELDLSDVE